MPSKKSNKESSNTEVTEKPKRTLNPIIKAMNDYRNNVIAEHVGSKAPRKTSPVFKLTLAAARTEMGLDDKDKNTIEVVNKAQSIFEANVSKYLKMAEVAEETSTKTEKPKKESKSKSSTKQVKETKSKKVVEKVEVDSDEDSEDEPVKAKSKSPAKGKAVKETKSKKVVQKKEIVVDSDSDSESDSD